MFAQIRTKNPSALPLRRSIEVPGRAIVRLGSRTPSSIIYKPGIRFVEVNTVESIENSRDKLRMKKCFATLDIPQAEWWSDHLDRTSFDEKMYPLVGKLIVGFKGHGMQLINNESELRTWLSSHNNGQYYLEKFYNYSREYRVHATQSHAFMSWRKLRRSDATERWFFNSSNCNWVSPEHPLFDRPRNWDVMEEAAVNAIRAVGLDIGAVDIRVQSKDTPKFIVLEVNSAPQLGEAGIEAYKNEIRNIIINKYDR